MDHAGRLRGRRAFGDGPRARFLGAGGQVGLQAERVEPNASQRIETWLVDTHVGEHLGTHGVGFLIVAQLDQLGLGLGVEEDRLSGSDDVTHTPPEVFVAEFLGVTVEHEDLRLCAEQVQVTQRRKVEPRLKCSRPAFKHGLRCLGCFVCGDQRLVLAGLLVETRKRVLDRLQIGKYQLGRDGLDVIGGRHLAVDVGDVLIAEHAGDLTDRVRLTNV